VIKKTLSTVWEIVDNSATASPVSIASIEAEQGITKIQIAFAPTIQLATGKPFQLTAAVAADFATALAEATKVATTSPVTT